MTEDYTGDEVPRRTLAVAPEDRTPIPLKQIEPAEPEEKRVLIQFIDQTGENSTCTRKFLAPMYLAFELAADPSKKDAIHSQLAQKANNLVYKASHDENGVQGEYLSVDTLDIGNRTICHYKDGKLHGPYKSIQNGKLYQEANYTNGELDGVVVTYAPSGSKARVDTYKGGKLNGQCLEFHADGRTVAVSTQYQEGMKNGKYFALHENGNPKEEGHYKDDKKHSRWHEYNTLGRPVAYGDYKEDLKVGHWRHTNAAPKGQHVWYGKEGKPVASAESFERLQELVLPQLAKQLPDDIKIEPLPGMTL